MLVRRLGSLRRTPPWLITSHLLVNCWRHLVGSLKRTLGLRAALRRGGGATGLSPAGKRSARKAASRRFRKGLAASFTRDGRIRWQRLFAPSAADGADSAPPPPPELPVKLELASGTGDWVAAQAAADAGAANWVACELKHDRVASLLSRVALGRVDNLAVVGGDGVALLRDRVSPEF
mmetsp:Transcript_12169/g.35849  ORF Transcript_12169/g.35849 Transcript_12169/m.35849 type:complete len:178 (-) Transcript_12169:10-543(-)